MEQLVSIFLTLLGLYLLFGLLFSLIFLWRGLQKVDEATSEAGFWFKLLIFPGMCALWPVFLKKWIQASRT